MVYDGASDDAATPFGGDRAASDNESQAAVACIRTKKSAGVFGRSAGGTVGFIAFYGSSVCGILFTLEYALDK